MRRSMSLSVAAAATLASALALGSGGATAGQFKNIHTPVPNAGCVQVVSSPENVSSAMAMEVYEFVSPAADAYRVCISSNSTGQDLIVRLIGLTGAPLTTLTTPINGTGCSAFVNLGSGFAFQVNVASGAGSPVNATAAYRLAVCRQ